VRKKVPTKLEVGIWNIYQQIVQSLNYWDYFLSKKKDLIEKRNAQLENKIEIFKVWLHMYSAIFSATGLAICFYHTAAILKNLLSL
jgi:hypothetical protein